MPKNMKYRHIFKNILLLLLLFVISLAPVVALFVISKMEQTQYSPTSDVSFEQLAYGEICEVTRTNVPQTVVINNCSVVSTTVKFIELGSYKDSSHLRIIIDYGEYIVDGDVIGYYFGEPVYATESGVVKSIHTGIDSYIMLDALDALAIEGYVDETSFPWRESDLHLTMDDHSFTILKIEDGTVDPSGTKVLLISSSASLAYGAKYNTLELETGRIFSNTLVVETRCVYSYPGSEKKYIRVVNHDGKFLGEVEVTTGYTQGNYVCISPKNANSIDDGTLCDGGYKMFIEGSTTID